jgi:hypothetical protein
VLVSADSHEIATMNASNTPSTAPQAAPLSTAMPLTSSERNRSTMPPFEFGHDRVLDGIEVLVRARR